MAFRFQAIDGSGRTVADVVEAASAEAAHDVLRQRGLFVTKLTQAEANAVPSDAPAVPGKRKCGGRLSDVIFFTQQMAMLVRSGARVVQAMEAIELQAARSCWRAVLRALREDVEQGKPLSGALGQFPKLFPPVYVNMVAAGEASGNISLAFDRLSSLTRGQQEVRSRVLGALTYPAVLMVLCLSVLVTLFTFVLPRFADMFASLDVTLPATTEIMIRISGLLGAYWYWALLGLAMVAGAIVVACRSPGGRRFLSRASVRVPLFGRLVRNVILARVCRIWGQLLESKVGLLDAVHLTQQSTNSLDFQELLAEVADAITQGNSIGPSLRQSWLLPKTFAAAMVTGEESGRLGESLLFVASCLEDDNAQVLASLTRIIEPIMLVVMGLIVGTVAISLFMPMFDMATIANR